MKQTQKGFTLIELMIVVAIIGILAAVAIPAYQDYVIKAKLSRVVSSLDPLKLTMGAYAQEAGDYPPGSAETINFSTTTTAVSANTMWSSLGLTTLPMLPAELSKLVYDYTAGGLTATPSVGPKFTLTFAATGVGSGIDGTTLVQVGQIGGTGLTWVCDSSSSLTSPVAKKFFSCP